MANLKLDYQLQPLAPCPNSKESMAIYEQHMMMVKEYFKVQAEIAQYAQKKQKLTQDLEQEQREQQTSARLIQEHNKLKEDHSSLKTKLRLIQGQQDS